MYAMLQSSEYKRDLIPVSVRQIPAGEKRSGGMRRSLTEDVRASAPIQRRYLESGVRVIQRATVAGFRNDSKNEKEIGDDVHKIVQEVFLDDETLESRYKLYIEYTFRNQRRADIVAVRDERDRNGFGDLWIYVGEIKPDSVSYNGFGGAAATQLADYMALFRAENPEAYVGCLYFWASKYGTIDYAGREYTLIIINRGGGLYTYHGVQDLSKSPKAQEEIAEIEDQDPDELLPFNERPDYMYM